MTNPVEGVNTFVVRLWAEDQDEMGTPLDWRGTIEHVQSGKIESFTDLKEAFQLMRVISGYGTLKKCPRSQ